MSKYLNLQIPTPCHEDWNKMKPEEKGRFCDSCQKCVMDFTNYTDAQLAQFFKSNKGDVCGRFRGEQLDTDIQIPKKRIPWVRYFFQVAIPAFLFSCESTAQGKVDARIEVGDKKNKACGDTLKEDTPALARGRVTDSNGNGIPFCTVMVKGTSRGTSADYLGYFLIKAKPTDILHVSSTGYTMVEVPVSHSGAIVLKDAPRYGEVIVISGMTICRKPKTKKEIRIEKKEIKAPAKTEVKNSFTIYPNPLQASSRISIKWMSPVSSQSFYIYDLNGNLIQKEDVAMEGQKESGFQLKNLIPGVYILKAIDEKTGKSSSQKFIVE